MRPHRQLLAGVLPRARAQHQVEDVFGVDGQAADLGAGEVERARDAAGFAAVAVQAEGADGGGGELDGVPFEDDGGLRGVAAAEEGGGRGGLPVGGEDGGLQGEEGGLGGGFGGVVARYGYVDDAAGGDGGGEEDGREFNLVGSVG